MADWSQLSPELLTLIAKCLDTRFDVLRFRSVCSSWRSSFPPKLYPLPTKLPLQNPNSIKYSPEVGDIMIDTIFLVRCPASAACRVVNVREYTHREKTQLLRPLLDHEVRPLVLKIPQVLDLTNFQVIELGHQFLVLTPDGFPEMFIDKAAFLWSNTNTNDFMVLTLIKCLDLYVVSSKSDKIESTLLETRTSDFEYFRDIISFKGKFYAIDDGGETTVVDQSLKLSFIGSPTGKKYCRKFLVQAGDNLLDVEMLAVSADVVGGEMVVDFRIFRLNEEEKKWDAMESLGDQILFLGVRQSVSASASEFYGVKGNLIFYSGLLCTSYHYGDSEDVFVFDLDTYATGPLEIFPEFGKLFWPPPEKARMKQPLWAWLHKDKRRYRRPPEQ
ncbi:hypothetical protein PTKIN_Ptkin13bG0261600 [Pterospermum kingtungense]